MLGRDRHEPWKGSGTGLVALVRERRVIGRFFGSAQSAHRAHADDIADRQFGHALAEIEPLFEALAPACADRHSCVGDDDTRKTLGESRHETQARSEEHTSELQSLMRISYAVFCLKKK